ncbi:hypothetical protein B0A50_00034 [Salinomyces thailandicus]|uniref:Uncharacterized protein n=1 Tax=Salinomyces thailandicus TaxID=706561 RepID=A0A4U0UF35_9PEZI|nr:hypothetical protein B0A50_00034 [Salinomyces thailandica]
MNSPTALHRSTSLHPSSPRLSSSGVTRSDSSTLYNAEPITKPHDHLFLASDSTDAASDAHDVDVLSSCVPVDARLQASGVEGTPLFTITEQNSLATLRTIPANTSFQRRVASWQALPSAPNTQLHKSSDPASGIKVAHRQCISLDENSIQPLSRSPRPPPSAPIVPPYQPPHRMQTPQGIPRWPNDELAAPRTPGTNGAPPEQGWRRWRHALSRAVARQAGASVAVPGGARRWRPPVSGHGTMGLEGEGFGSAATLRESGTQGGQQRDVEPRSRRPEGAGGTAMRSSFIASRRALAGAGGQTVMVPPARAAKHVQFTQQDRTASLPERQRLRSPPPYLPQAQVDFPTGRTAELLQHFPVPPDRASSGAAPPQRPTAAPVAEGARPQVWSLFPPRPSTPVGSKASFSNLQAWLSGRPQSPAQSSTTPTRRKLQKRTQPAPTANATLTPPSDEPSPLASLSTAAPALPPLPFQPRPEGGLLAEHSPERTAISSQDDDDTCDRPAVRGEANARYRYSGTPIYELDAASLRSSDERAEQEGLAEAQLDGARGAEAERNPEDEETRRSANTASPFYQNLDCRVAIKMNASAPWTPLYTSTPCAI